MIFRILFIFILTFSSTSSMCFAAETFLEKQQEEHAQNIFKEIKCTVCKGQSIAESEAFLAIDLRIFIREQLKENKTEEQIKAYLIERYGDEISFKPPYNKTTYFLWFGPFLFLILGSFLLFKFAFKK